MLYGETRNSVYHVAHAYSAPHEPYPQNKSPTQLTQDHLYGNYKEIYIVLKIETTEQLEFRVLAGKTQVPKENRATLKLVRIMSVARSLHCWAEIQKKARKNNLHFGNLYLLRFGPNWLLRILYSLFCPKEKIRTFRKLNMSSWDKGAVFTHRLSSDFFWPISISRATAKVL